MSPANGYYRDLRDHIKALADKGLLVEIDRVVNKDSELHPLVRLQFRGLPEAKRRAFLFRKVVDARKRSYAIPVLVGGSAASEEIYALGLQCAPEEIVNRWNQALSKPIAPTLVNTGKVKEVVHTGKKFAGTRRARRISNSDIDSGLRQRAVFHGRLLDYQRPGYRHPQHGYVPGADQRAASHWTLHWRRQQHGN